MSERIKEPNTTNKSHVDGNEGDFDDEILKTQESVFDNPQSNTKIKKLMSSTRVSNNLNTSLQLNKDV